MKKFSTMIIGLVTMFGFIISASALQGGENPDVTFRVTNDLNFFDVRSSEVVSGQTEIQLDWIAGEKLGSTDLAAFLNQTPGIGSAKGSLYITLEVALNSNGAYKDMKTINNTGEWDKTNAEVVYSTGTEDDRDEKPLTFSFWPYGLRYEIKDATTGNFRSPTTAEKNAITTGSIKHQLAQLLDVEESEVADLYLEEYRFTTLYDRFFIMRYDFYNASNTLLNSTPEFFKISYNRIVPTFANNGDVTILKGAKYQLDDTVTYGTDKTPLTSNTVLYESSDTDVVTVDNTGKLTAVAPGTATVKLYLTGWKDVVYSDVSVTVVDGTHEEVEGQQLFEIEKAALSEISSKELEVYKESEENYKLTVNDDEEFAYSWEFETIDDAIDFNPTLNVINAKESNEIKSIVNDEKALVLSFEHEGDLPGTAKVVINVKGIYSNGSKVNLYHYNETTKKAELISENLVVTDDTITIEINHCSDYILTTGIVKNPKTGDGIMNYILLGSISMIGIVGYAMYQNKKKSFN